VAAHDPPCLGEVRAAVAAALVADLEAHALRRRARGERDHAAGRRAPRGVDDEVGQRAVQALRVAHGPQPRGGDVDAQVHARERRARLVRGPRQERAHAEGAHLASLTVLGRERDARGQLHAQRDAEHERHRPAGDERHPDRHARDHAERRHRHRGDDERSEPGVRSHALHGFAGTHGSCAGHGFGPRGMR
jgi:hypothetical protein